MADKLSTLRLRRSMRALNMHRLICASTLFLLIATVTSANPWEVRAGSTLLDGTKTATYVAGHMFLGKDYEMTSSQLSLRCVEDELVMDIIGNSDLLTKAKAEDDPTIEVLFKVGSELVSFEATIVSLDWGRERARVHNGPGLMEFLRQHDGDAAQVQLPVASTGIPEVRKLSLENFRETTDLVLATCGPIEVWEIAAAAPLAETENSEPTSDAAPMDLETALSVGIAKKLVEELIRNQKVSIEEIVEALGPLAKASAQ